MSIEPTECGWGELWFQFFFVIFVLLHFFSAYEISHCFCRKFWRWILIDCWTHGKDKNGSFLISQYKNNPKWKLLFKLNYSNICCLCFGPFSTEILEGQSTHFVCGFHQKKTSIQKQILTLWLDQKVI